MRVDERCVKIDAPDVVVAFGSLLAGVHGALFAIAMSPLALVVCACCCLLVVATARVHLRVRPGSAFLVRTVLGVPWWIAHRDARHAAPESVWFWDTWDCDELVFPSRVVGRPSVVMVELRLAGVSPELGLQLDSEIRRVLRSTRWCRRWSANTRTTPAARARSIGH